MNQLPDDGKEGIKQVGLILKEIVSRLTNQPAFLFGIASMLLAVIVFVYTASFVSNNPILIWFPYALLIFGLILIFFSYFSSGKADQTTTLHAEKDESMAIGPTTPDGHGGLFSGTFKVLYLHEKQIGQCLNISVESNGHPLCIELWQAAFDGSNVESWLSKRRHKCRSATKPDPNLTWKIDKPGEYTVYFVAYDKGGKRANFDISYRIEAKPG